MHPVSRLRCGMLVAGLAGVLGCQAPATVPNPLHVAESDLETVWTRTVDVVNDCFPIESEDRRSGQIRCAPLPAASLGEPWYRDSRTFRDRLEATLQTLRRRALVTVARLPEGGHSIQVEVHKELAEVPSADRPLLAERADRVGQPVRLLGPPEGGWIDRGRDAACEQWLLRRIQQAFQP